MEVEVVWHRELNVEVVEAFQRLSCSQLVKCANTRTGIYLGNKTLSRRIRLFDVCLERASQLALVALTSILPDDSAIRADRPPAVQDGICAGWHPPPVRRTFLPRDPAKSPPHLQCTRPIIYPKYQAVK